MTTYVITDWDGDLVVIPQAEAAARNLTPLAHYKSLSEAGDDWETAYMHQQRQIAALQLRIAAMEVWKPDVDRAARHAEILWRAKGKQYGERKAKGKTRQSLKDGDAVVVISPDQANEFGFGSDKVHSGKSYATMTTAEMDQEIIDALNNMESQRDPAASREQQIRESARRGTHLGFLTSGELVQK